MEKQIKLPYREPECSLWELVPETIIAASGEGELDAFNPLSDYELQTESFFSIL